jgi:hypothetical protein
VPLAMARNLAGFTENTKSGPLPLSFRKLSCGGLLHRLRQKDWHEGLLSPGR